MTTALTTKSADPTRLSPQEKQIVDTFFAKGFDTARTAEALGLDTKTVCEVLQREAVKRTVGLAMLSESKERFAEVRDAVMLALWQLATFDIADLFDEDNKIRDIRAIPAELRCAIKGYKMGKFGPEFQFVDRAAILTTLANIFAKAGDKPAEQEKTVLVVHDDEEEEPPHDR